MKLFAQITLLVVTAVLGYGTRYLEESPDVRGTLTIHDMASSTNTDIDLASEAGTYLIKFFPHNSCPEQSSKCINKQGRNFVLQLVALKTGGIRGQFEVCSKIINLGQLTCDASSWNKLEESEYYDVDRGTYALVRTDGTVNLRGAVLYWHNKANIYDGYIVDLPYKLSVQKKGLSNMLPIIAPNSRKPI